MDYDDYDAETDEMETEATVEALTPVEIKFTVSPERMAAEIAANVRNQVAKVFDKQVEKNVREAVTRLVDSVARERIDAAVAAVLAEGWVITDTYGTPTGTKTLKQRISDTLNAKGYNGQTHASELIAATVTKALQNEFSTEITRLRTELRARVDTMLGEKVAGAVRDAIGLR